MPLLEGLGRDVPKTGVQTPTIIVYFYVFENLFLRLLACRESFSMDGLDLQAVVPALHGRIVKTVTLLTHAGDEAMGLQEAPIVMRAVLAAAVGVEDNTAGPLAPPQCHAQGIAGEFRRHPFRHGPPHDLAGVEVEHHGQIQPAFVRG